MVSCLADDYNTILEGTDNCWAYWLQGFDIDGVDQFVWLTKETITCDAGTGRENCMVLKEIPCNASKIARLALSEG